jgi:hypothetical protein
LFQDGLVAIVRPNLPLKRTGIFAQGILKRVVFLRFQVLLLPDLEVPGAANVELAIGGICTSVSVHKYKKSL